MATVQEKKNAPLPTRLRKLVSEGTLTQKEIADRVGVKPQSISQYLDGTVNPSYAVLIGIADLFHVSTDYLLGRTEIATDDLNKADIEKYLGLSQKAIDKLMSDRTIKNVINHILCSGSAGVYAKLAAAIHDEIYICKRRQTRWPTKVEALRQSLLSENMNRLDGLTAVIFSEEDFIGENPLGAETRDLPTSKIIVWGEIAANQEAFLKRAEEIGYDDIELEKLQRDIKPVLDLFTDSEDK